MVPVSHAVSPVVWRRIMGVVGQSRTDSITAARRSGSSASGPSDDPPAAATSARARSP